MDEVCAHLQQLEDPARKPVQPSGHGCKECLEIGDGWVHLRLCLSCGHVGCCDSSPNRHARKHAKHDQHPTVRSYEPGEDWAYCFPDDSTVDYLKALPGEAAGRHYSPPNVRR
jgi:uncharacterized UBP type Zn finger protein